ncbi:MAG: histidinol-phosphate transaminase [Ilumatobacteraceae bacterium]
MTSDQIGRPRTVVADLPAYRPGKGAAQAESEHGITNAIKLASNENPAQPVDPIIEAIRAAAAGVNRYADHRATAVREALAAQLGVAIEGITVGNGSTGILQQLFMGYVDPGDEVVFPWRSFEVYPVFTRLMAGTPVLVPLAPDLGVDTRAVADAVTARTKLVMIATPNNPTGVATTTAQLRSLMADVPTTTVVCIDEAYREFVDPAFGDPVTELLPDFPNAIVTRTFSKAHGLAGLRAGYAVGHPDVVGTVDATMLPFSVNALAQAGALAAIEHTAEIRLRVDEIVAERTRVEAELVAVGWSLPDHQGNFVWLATDARTDAIALDLERRGVVIRAFSGEGIRVSIGTPTENDRFLTTLAAIGGPVAEG